MEEFLSNLYSYSTAPFWSALLLGLMTAISPCPLATNITAIGFISKDLENRNKVFYNGLIYTLGRVASYTLLAVVIILGAGRFNLSGVFQQYGEKVIGPALILIGLFMLGVLKFRVFQFFGLSNKLQQQSKHTYLQVFFLGFLFALTFCPYSGVLYFGMLIPMSIQSASGLFLPVVYAVATGIPVIIFAWILAFTVSGVGKLYNGIKLFEIWFRRIVAVLFIGTGLYYFVLVTLPISLFK